MNQREIIYLISERKHVILDKIRYGKKEENITAGETLIRTVSLRTEFENLRKTYESLAPAEARVRELMALIDKTTEKFNMTDTRLCVDVGEMIVSWNPYGTFGRLDETVYVLVRKVDKRESEAGEMELDRTRKKLQAFLIEMLDAREDQIKVEFTAGCLEWKPPEMQKRRKRDREEHAMCA